jgi:predicted metal-dependent enzyme (double-stranded beta helix superfamily)
MRMAHGLVGVFEGELEETRYARVDGAAGPATGRLLVPGDTSIVLARTDIHRLANHGPGRAISIHVYCMDLSDDPTRINLPVLPAALR